MSEVKEFYVDDLVYKFDNRKRIQFGVVIDSYEASDTDEYPALQKGQILVSWNHGKKQICKQNKVKLMNRCIIPGDIVRRLVDGKETQRGYCKSTNQVTTVQIVGTSKIVDNVSSKRLPSVKIFDVGNAVCLGNKFGRIQGVHQLLKMESKCGSIVEIPSTSNYHNIKDFWSVGDFETYYPGQTVICTPMDLNDAKWIKKSKTIKKHMENGQIFTIQSAEYTSIEVWWYNFSNNKGHTEFSELSKEDIKKLKVLHYTTDLEISDRSLLRLRKNDKIMKKSEWIRKQSLIYFNDKVPEVKINSENNVNNISEDDWLTEEETEIVNDVVKTKPKKKNSEIYKFGPGSILPVDVICTHSTVTVVWQDGTEEENIPTTQLYYSVSLDDHEFFPGEWVTFNCDEQKLVKYGIIQKVNNLERTAEVKLCAGSVKNFLLKTEEISVYDLNKHHKYVFRPGSIVKAKPTQDDKVGRVIDSCPQGYVIVQWLNGVEENCCPRDIELIPDMDEYEFSDHDSDIDDFSFDSGSWETQSVESFDGDITDQINLEIMAHKVEYMRDRLIYLKDVLKQYQFSKDFNLPKDLICIYYNSRYLDKFLGTSFFSLESKHFQALYQETTNLAKTLNIEFAKENFVINSTKKLRSVTEENFQNILKLESRINLEIEKGTTTTTATASSCPTTPISDVDNQQQIQIQSISMELILMLKHRMDLIYAEIISKIGGKDSLTVLTDSLNKTTKSINYCFQPPTPDESFGSNTAICNNSHNHQPSTDHSVFECDELNESFSILEDEQLESHHYYTKKFKPVDLQKFINCLKKEYKLLKDSLPPGILVKTFANRTDLLSVMIRGPAKTPYEDGLFFFDIQFSEDYPFNPPLVYYISYSSEMLNPNLYVEGKVCVSLLGTWKGRGSEIWTPNSTLLQLIVSIQGLILVAEPYYNEAGYEKQTNTQQGYENSRTYNELVILKLVQSMTALLNSIPPIFKNEVLAHFSANGNEFCERLKKYCNNELKPDFPLLPVSKGLKLSLDTALKQFQQTLKRVLSNVN